MLYEYVVRTPDGDRPHSYEDGQPLDVGVIVRLTSGEQFTVTKVLERLNPGQKTEWLRQGPPGADD